MQFVQSGHRLGVSTASLIAALMTAWAATSLYAENWQSRPLPNIDAGGSLSAASGAYPPDAPAAGPWLGTDYGGDPAATFDQSPTHFFGGSAGHDSAYAACADCDCEYGWHVLPEQLIYRSYLAAVTDPRMGAVFNLDEGDDWNWDLAIGGRVGLLRYGSGDCTLPQGWQLDVEAAAFPRLNPVAGTVDLVGTDFRAGIPLSYGQGRHQFKIAYFHLSSHMGDEFAIRYGALGSRINYSRDAIVVGHSYMATDALRFYGEVSAAFKSDISETWHFQFGCEYSQLTQTGTRGSPFLAVNTQLRQENNFGGRITIQGGWQWTSSGAGRRYRFGLQYYNGHHEKYQFLHASEQKIGVGMWYDF